jgi:hypothetical protein
MPAYYAARIQDFLTTDTHTILGKLISQENKEGYTDHKNSQTSAWEVEIPHLKDAFVSIDRKNHQIVDWYIVLEYRIPRREKRIDAVILASNLILVVEYKVGKGSYALEDARQAEDYCLDLRDFHAQSRSRTIIPILVSTNALSYQWPESIGEGFVKNIFRTNEAYFEATVVSILEKCDLEISEIIDYEAWDKSAYQPTPTIIEAAQTLYSGKDIREISHAHAGSENLTETTEAVIQAIETAKLRREKIICFITGIPGSGKTLAGLNIVHNPKLQTDSASLGVFLSGNGPLVRVLTEALARDNHTRSDQKIALARRKASTFIQNVHRFIDEYVKNNPDQTPEDKVIIFDEAQRAWNAEQSYRKFQRAEAEPNLILRIMDRNPDWAVIVALIGGGQEINSGEAGLPEWGRALSEEFPHWKIFVSPELAYGTPNSAGDPLFLRQPENLSITTIDALHLSVAIRAYKANATSDWVNALLNGEPQLAREKIRFVTEFPIFFTRSIETMRAWLNQQARGYRRCGLVASSGARRLRPYGLDVTLNLAVEDWFLAPRNDVRSSYYLEVPATEFAIQGLELDWVGLCWGADLRRENEAWGYYRFVGTKWQHVRQSIWKQYVINKYRVLLTRAREGMIIWIPRGSHEDPTRNPNYYARTAEYLRECGLEEL